MADVKIVSGIEVHCSYDKIVPVKKLRPRKKNPNKHPEEQILLYGKVLKGNGWRRPITVSNLSGFITRGHGARLAAIELGLKSVPVDYQDYESEDAEWADILADNELARKAKMDMPMVADILSDFEGDFDKELTGYMEAEIDSLVEGVLDGVEHLDLEEELIDLNMEEVVREPIWVVVRTTAGNKDALEEVFSVLKNNKKIKIEKSYD